MSCILVVDDEPALRRTLRAMLEKAGHTVMEAGDGDQAVAVFKERPVDLVLTDIIMPNREGIETLGALRRLDAEVPIIAMSGGGSKGGELFLTLASQLGATQTLAKPIRQADLVDAVEVCLAGEV